MFVAPVNHKSRVYIVASLCLNADPAPRATMVGPSRGAYTRVALRDSGFYLPGFVGALTPACPPQHERRLRAFTSRSYSPLNVPTSPRVVCLEAFAEILGAVGHASP